MRLTILQARAFVALDEWLGGALLAFLRVREDWTFWPVLVVWAVLVYGISYPALWAMDEESGEGT